MKHCILGLLGFFLVSNGNLQAQTNSNSNSVNSRNVSNFIRKLTGTNALRIGTFGDSVCDPYAGGKINGFINPLVTQYGRSGGVKSNFPYLYYAFAGGAATIPPNTNWWSNHIFLTNGASVTFLSGINSGPDMNNVEKVWADSARVYFLNQPGAGTFTISIATNGGPFGIVAKINANATRGSVITNFSLPLNYYQLEISGTSGTNTIIDAGLWNENQLNVTYAGDTQPGANFPQWTAISTNITWPIWTEINPTICLVEAKDSVQFFQSAFPDLENMFSNCTPNMDAIYIGTTPSASGDETFAIPQNALMRNFAITNNHFYWDGYSIFASYAEATAKGYTTGDGTHFNAAGGLFLGDLLWKDLLKSVFDVVINVKSNNAEIQWATYTDIPYRIQWTDNSASNHWQNLGAPVLGTGSKITIGDSTEDYIQRFYRVKLGY